MSALNFDHNPFLTGADAAAVQLADIRIDIDDIESTEAPLLQRTPPRSAPQSPPAATTSQGSRLQQVVGRSCAPSGYRQLSSDADAADSCAVQQRPLSPTPQRPECELSASGAVPKATPQLCAAEEDASTGGAADSVAEVNSVEEALRALDFAISGEDSLQLFDDEDDDDDDDDNDDEIVEEEAVPEIRASDCANRIAQVDACHEAKQLVDDVLQQALLIAAGRQQPHNNTGADAPTVSMQSKGRAFDATESLNDTVVDRTVAAAQPKLAAEELKCVGVQPVELPPNSSEPSTPLDPNSSSDSAFDFDTLPIEASTPFVHKQFSHHAPSASSIDGAPLAKKISHKLFDNVLGTAASPGLDDSLGTAQFSPIVVDDEVTFTAPAAAAADGTFVAASDGTFVCAANATFDAASDRTFPATEAAPRSGHLPPEIRISGDGDTVSVDLTTATPVNTPIELNYSLDSWDKFISSSMQQKPPPQQQQQQPLQTAAVDRQQPCTSRQAREADVKAAAEAAGGGIGSNDTFEMNSSGWFVATQQQQPGNETFEVNNATVTLATEDGGNANDDDDDEDDDEDAAEDGALLSLTFDALRKQLAEALPHAQGSMAGPQDFSDDEDEAAGGAAATAAALSSAAGADSDFDFETQ